jgi:DNA-binding CsgD family transcriptional regulator
MIAQREAPEWRASAAEEMMAQNLKTGSKERDTAAVAQGAPRDSGGSLDDELVATVRTLVDWARQSPTPTKLRRGGERVLLDAEVDGFRCLLLAPKPAVAQFHVLSPREQEIVRMVAEGYPNKTIATVLDISSWTVSTYLRRIFAKLDVRSRAAMVARALDEGLLTQSDASRPARQPTSRL